MLDIRADADHIEVKLGKEQNIICHAFIRLAGNADHNAGAGFIADLFEYPQRVDARWIHGHRPDMPQQSVSDVSSRSR